LRAAAHARIHAHYAPVLREKKAGWSAEVQSLDLLSDELFAEMDEIETLLEGSQLSRSLARLHRCLTCGCW